MTTETNLKNALVAIGLTTSDVENIANGSMVVEETNLDIRSKEFAIAFFHSSIDGTIEDYELFMNSDEDFTPWQPFEYSDKDSRVELVCDMQGNLENWFKIKLKESNRITEEKMHHECEEYKLEECATEEKTTDIATLKVGDNFQDHEIYSKVEKNFMQFNIIGDHVYEITDSQQRLIVARDIGNGNGVVMHVIDYNNAESEIKDDENSSLAYENKMMADALIETGLSQEQISTICSGNLSVLKKSKENSLDKMYHTRNGAYYDCWRWHADALTFLSDRNIDIVPIQVVKDLEDGVIVEIVLQDEFDIERLKNHIADYYNDQLGMYPENTDDELDAKAELENLIAAIKQAQDDGFDYITLEAE